MSYIEPKTQDEASNIVIDTLKKDKQVIVFVNTKKGAEAAAERITSYAKKELKNSYPELADEILKALGSPTRQCRRLASMIKSGVAFHHSGLSGKQRAIVEDNFREKKLKVICATPTLAAGIDLPAYRVVLRDMKRYTGRGMSYIPVLEFEQMSGRAGRPSYDKEGQAILIAKNEAEREELWYKYIEGEPEDILSKLAVEPVLRTYVLSLIATGFVGSVKELEDFMSRTFYAKQYGDLNSLNNIVEGIVRKLEEWEFVITSQEQEDFVSANEMEEGFKVKATKLGERVSELYLDPLTANELLEGMRKATNITSSYGILHLITSTLEMQPLIKARQKDYPFLEEKLVVEEDNFIADVPSEFSEEYDDFLHELKTAYILEEWMQESTEEYLYEEYNVAPGELNGKLDRADWLLYSCYELAGLQGFRELRKDLYKLRLRLKDGIKEELLKLVKIRGIGRVRARKLFNNRIRDVKALKEVDITSLAQILGKNTAVNVKSQVGQEYDKDKVSVKKNKRKGQVNLGDF